MSKAIRYRYTFISHDDRLWLPRQQLSPHVSTRPHVIVDGTAGNLESMLLELHGLEVEKEEFFGSGLGVWQAYWQKRICFQSQPLRLCRVETLVCVTIPGQSERRSDGKIADLSGPTRDIIRMIHSMLHARGSDESTTRRGSMPSLKADSG